MAKSIICINLYGHADPAIAGKPASSAPMGAFLRSTSRAIKRSRTLGVVSADLIGEFNLPGKKIAILDYNAALGEEGNKSLPQAILTGPIATCSDEDEQFFLVTGYSSGGLSAIHVARFLNKMGLNLYYVGLADAAFQRGESDYLIQQSALRGKYLKNYYQTQENDPKNPEIHDEVVGFTNFNLDNQLAQGEDFHQSAVIIGNKRMLEDVTWCIRNC